MAVTATLRLTWLLFAVCAFAGAALATEEESCTAETCGSHVTGWRSKFVWMFGGEQKIKRDSIDTRPLLCLTMIVKDEASSIDRVLRNVLPHVDMWAILDTGSTDGTQDMIRAIAADFPKVQGRLEEEPFVDFSTSRNRILDIALEMKPMFTLMLDGDWYLHDPNDDLRKFLDSKRHATTEKGYLMRVNQNNFSLDYWSGRILRVDSKLRYEGVVHEVPSEVIEDMIPETAMLNWTATAINQAMSNKRWERDLVLLQREHERRPFDARTAFYLAQTYGSLNMHEDAAAMYGIRKNLTGWSEETYVAMLREAEHYFYAGYAWADVLELYLQAWEYLPQRAESLQAIAKYYHEQDNMHLCGLFAVKAFSIPYPPPHSLFVYKRIYDYDIPYTCQVCAWYSKDYEVGLKASEKVLENVVDEERRERILANQYYYYNSLKRPVPKKVKAAYDKENATEK